MKAEGSHPLSCEQGGLQWADNLGGNAELIRPMIVDGWALFDYTGMNPAVAVESEELFSRMRRKVR